MNTQCGQVIGQSAVGGQKDRILVVAQPVVDGGNLHKLPAQVQHPLGVGGLLAQDHIAGNGDEIRGQAVYFRHQIGVVVAKGSTVQVGKLYDAQVADHLIAFDLIEGQIQPVIGKAVVQCGRYRQQKQDHHQNHDTPVKWGAAGWDFMELSHGRPPSCGLDRWTDAAGRESRRFCLGWR